MSALSPSTTEPLAGRYRLVREIGRGGMGRVYEAHDDRLDREVALKLIEADAAEDQEFAREARAAANLTHPSIVRVFDAGTCPEGSFIVMELVGGDSLKGRLSLGRPMPVREALDIAATVADALEHAHGQGIVHCDVKPHNILLTENGQPKLADFGIARAATLTATRADGVIEGSAPYLAPEQLDGSRPDARTDVYALGAVLYEMLTGRPPFQGRSLAEVVSRRLAADPLPPSSVQPSLSPAIDRLVLRALARDPSQRFASAADFRDALRAGGGDVPDVTQTVRISRVIKPPIDSSGVEPGTDKPGSPSEKPGVHHWNAGLPTWWRTRWIPLSATTALIVALALILFMRAGHVASAVVAPELTGRQMSDVPTLLEQAHLQLGDISTSPGDPARAGTVVSQQPAAGQQVRAGAKVQLVIGVAR